MHGVEGKSLYFLLTGIALVQSETVDAETGNNRGKMSMSTKKEMLCLEGGGYQKETRSKLKHHLLCCTKGGHHTAR